MMSFKEQLEKDFESVFFNMDEFAEIHSINGAKIPIVVDNEKLLEMNLGKTVETNGIIEDDIMFFVRKKDLSEPPVVDNLMDFDGETYPIGHVLEDLGGYTVILRGNAG